MITIHVVTSAGSNLDAPGQGTTPHDRIAHSLHGTLHFLMGDSLFGPERTPAFSRPAHLSVYVSHGLREVQFILPNLKPLKV